MKTRITAGLVALAVLVVAFAAVASASSSTTSKGKLDAFSYTTSSKTGHLAVQAKRRTLFRVPASANCGVSYGQSGDQIPCKTLGRAKYRNKPVRVTWKRAADGSRVASLVAVDLS